MNRTTHNNNALGCGVLNVEISVGETNSKSETTAKLLHFLNIHPSFPFFSRAKIVIDQDQPIRVFKNLTHDCYSILQNGKLKASARQVLLSDVEFKVRESRASASTERTAAQGACFRGGWVGWLTTCTRATTGNSPASTVVPSPTTQTSLRCSTTG